MINRSFVGGTPPKPPRVPSHDFSLVAASLLVLALRPVLRFALSVRIAVKRSKDDTRVKEFLRPTALLQRIAIVLLPHEFVRFIECVRQHKVAEFA